MHAFAQGAYGEAVRLLEPLFDVPRLDQLARIGGSHAQREVFEDTMLEAYLRAEQFDKAEAMLRTRLQRRASVRDLFWLGRAQVHSGQPAAARVSLREVTRRWQDADPGSPELATLTRLAAEPSCSERVISTNPPLQPHGSLVETKRCLVLLPVGVTRRTEGPTFLAIYEHVLLPALRATGFPLEVLRGDEVLRAGMTLHAGRLWLQEPHLVVADLTTRHSGVIHDLSLRDFLADRTILLSQRAEDMLPRFAAYRQIVYTLAEAGIARLHQGLRHHVGEILGATFPRTALPVPGNG
jgi:hypothetical protein